MKIVVVEKQQVFKHLFPLQVEVCNDMKHNKNATFSRRFNLSKTQDGYYRNWLFACDMLIHCGIRMVSSTESFHECGV
jgi:hypothetical protein